MDQGRTTQNKKSFYEVFLELLSHGRKVGKTCIQIEAASPFMAAVKADKAIEGRYGESIVARTIRVAQITEDEFFYCMVA